MTAIKLNRQAEFGIYKPAYNKQMLIIFYAGLYLTYNNTKL